MSQQFFLIPNLTPISLSDKIFSLKMNDEPEASFQKKLQVYLEEYTQELQKKIEQHIQNEFKRLFFLKATYLAMNAFALCFFAVVLFFDARRYHNILLWGIAICLLIFSLIQFLELDHLTQKSSFIKKLFGPRS